jgi:hypothetical protein
MRFRQARRWKWYHHWCLFHPINKILREQNWHLHNWSSHFYYSISFRKKKPFSIIIRWVK